jgi:hypothetical protein
MKKNDFELVFYYFNDKIVVFVIITGVLMMENLEILELC